MILEVKRTKNKVLSLWDEEPVPLSHVTENFDERIAPFGMIDKEVLDYLLSQWK